MKKTFKYMVMAGAVLMGLAACKSDEFGNLFRSHDDGCISFTATVEEETVTRAIDMTPIDFDGTQQGKPLVLSSTITDRNTQEVTRGLRISGDSVLTTFGVTAIQAPKNVSDEQLATLAPNLFYNLQATKSTNTSYCITQDYYWPTDDEKLFFYAYAPYNGTDISVAPQVTAGPQKLQFTVNTDVTKQVDLVTAAAATTAFNSASGAAKTAAVPLEFQHELTAIRFIIGEQWLAGSIKSIAIRNVHGKGTLTIGSHEWKWKALNADTCKADNDFELTLDKTGLNGTVDEAIMTGDFANHYFLMIPQEFDNESEAYLEVVYQDNAKDYTVTASLKGQTWARNKTVVYAISSTNLTTLKIGDIVWPTAGTWAGPKTVFEDKDSIGLYVVDDGGNNIVHSNVKCTFNGSAWTIHHPATPVYKLPGYQYFFYYPYNDKPDTSYPLQGQNNTNTAAATFYSSLIEGWTPAQVQSSEEMFKKQDLQVGKGVDHAQLASTVDVLMAHQMNIGEITLGTKNVTGTTTYPISANCSWYHAKTIPNVTASAQFDTNIPLLNDSKYYYVFKPVTDLGTQPGTLLKGIVGTNTVDWSYYLQTTDRSKKIEQTVYTNATADETLENAIVIADIPTMTFTGAVQTPTISVKLNGTEMTKGTDYTVTYKNSNNEDVSASDLKDAGTYTALIAPAGDYSGDTAEKSFTIQPLSTLSALKTWVNNGKTYSGYLGYYVKSDGTISSSDANAIGKIGWISTSAVDASYSNSRIMIVAADIAGQARWKTSSSAGESNWGSRTALDGYNFTVNHNNSTYPAAQMAYAYNNSVSTPSGASPWFLPSVRQFINIYDVFLPSGSSFRSWTYYTATESTDDVVSAAWCVFPGGYYGQGPNNPPTGWGPENSVTSTMKYNNGYSIICCCAY